MSVKIKSIKSHASPQLLESFNEMLNTGGKANLRKIIPKLAKMISTCKTIELILLKISKSDISTEKSKNEIINWLSEHKIDNFIIKKENIDIFKNKLWVVYYEYVDFCQTNNFLITDKEIEKNELFIEWSKDLSEKYNDDLSKIHEEFSQIKSSNCINVYIIICNNLIKYKKFLSFDIKNVEIPNESLTFIKRMIGTDFIPLNEITSLNFYDMYINGTDGNNGTKYLIIISLAQLYKFTLQIYKFIMSPDIDIEEFNKMMLEQIEVAKKMVPRCNEAFDTIKSSMHLLNDNFEIYYKEFVTTKNPACIMEEYIKDICGNKATTKPQVIRQFRDIITFFRKSAVNQTGGNLQMNSMLRMMEQKYNMLDRESEKMPDIEDYDTYMEKNATVKLSKNQKRHLRRKKQRETLYNTQNKSDNNENNEFNNYSEHDKTILPDIEGEITDDKNFEDNNN